MKQEQCTNCGHPAPVVRGGYEFKESGLSSVVLYGIEIVQCGNCGNQDPIIPRVNELMRLLALAVIAKPYPLQGEDVKFLRKYLKMTGEEFSRHLHIDKTTLSKWENGADKIGPQSDRLIRLIALALGEGLQDKLEELTRQFTRIEDVPTIPRIDVNMTGMSYRYA